MEGSINWGPVFWAPYMRDPIILAPYKVPLIFGNSQISGFPVCLKDHINLGILHSGSKVQDKRDSRNSGFEDPCVYVVPWAPSTVHGHVADMSDSRRIVGVPLLQGAALELATCMWQPSLPRNFRSLWQSSRRMLASEAFTLVFQGRLAWGCGGNSHFCFLAHSHKGLNVSCRGSE